MPITTALYFFIYAFLGWCCEVVFAALKQGKFINRGFLNGPYCPIYGFGVLLVLTALYPDRGNLPLLFVGSVIITSALELVGGFLMEKLFHHRWWDYSDMPFNLGGYICPLFSVLWGIACLIVVATIHPLIMSMVALLRPTPAIVLLASLSILFLIDLVATVATVLKLNKKLTHIEEIASKMRVLSNDLGENLADSALDISEKKNRLDQQLEQRKESLETKWNGAKSAYDQRRTKLRTQWNSLQSEKESVLDNNFFGQNRLLNAFPSLRSINHKEALEQLRQRKKAGGKHIEEKHPHTNG